MKRHITITVDVEKCTKCGEEMTRNYKVRELGLTEMKRTSFRDPALCADCSDARRMREAKTKITKELKGMTVVRCLEVGSQLNARELLISDGKKRIVVYNVSDGLHYCETEKR